MTSTLACTANHSSPSLVPLAFGDIQGCRSAFHALLKKAQPSAQTPLWFVGDIINRGVDSLGTLRDVMAFGARATTVLGNHELHLLAVAAGVRTIQKGDTVTDILKAPDAPDLIHWLRHRPLVHYEHGWLMVHAGVLPQWDITHTLEYAHELETALRGPQWRECLLHLNTPSFGASHSTWNHALKGYERLRVIANVFTKMRFCYAYGDREGQMELDAKWAKGPLHRAPENAGAWFDMPHRATADTSIVFGHWASLGLLMRDRVCGLDTGCIWGGELSAASLHAQPEQRSVFQVSCAPIAE